jgi:hypothetical protein
VSLALARHALAVRSAAGDDGLAGWAANQARGALGASRRPARVLAELTHEMEGGEHFYDGSMFVVLQTGMPIEPGDIVYLIATGAAMTVESVADDRAVCTFAEYSRRPVPEGCERKVIGHGRDAFALTALRADSRKLKCDRCDGTLRGLMYDMYRCENGHERTGMEVAATVHIHKIEVSCDDPDRIAFGITEQLRAPRCTPLDPDRIQIK